MDLFDTSGMRAAAEHAEACHTGWLELAIDGLRRFSLAYGKPFTIEQARAGLRELPEPPDLRAWGAVTAAAIKQDVIRPMRSFAPARSSNGAMKRRYVAGMATLMR